MADPTAQRLSFSLGVAAPLASYALRMYGDRVDLDYIGGTGEVAAVLLVLTPALVYAAYPFGLKPAAQAVLAGFALGGALAYAWWLALGAHATWQLSLMVLVIEAAVLATVVLVIGAVTHAVLKRRESKRA